MRVMHNIPALQAYNALTATNSSLQKSIEKLSTGLRINNAADDAAGLAISEKMRAQIRGLDRATMNAQDGISMIQTAEGALNETHSILQRMRELSVQAANDTLTQEDRGYIQVEIDQLKEEVTRIATTTQFNKKKLLDGSAAVLWSSDNLATKAIVNGGLRQVDQFGQKSALEGNYKLTISATPGQGEVQKTDIFKIKHKNVIMNLTMAKEKGINNVEIDNLPAGTYKIYKQKITSGLSSEVVSYGQGLITNNGQKVIGGPDKGKYNASILLEAIKVNSSAGSVTYRAQINLLKTDGTIQSVTINEVTISKTGMSSNMKILGDSFYVSATGIKLNGAANTYSIGDKSVLNIQANGGTAAGSVGIAVSATIHNKDTWQYGWGSKDAPATQGATYVLSSTALTPGKEIQFKNFYLNTIDGTVYQGNVKITFGTEDEIKKLLAAQKVGTATMLSTFEAAFVGQVAKGDVKLRDLDKFWDANGRFLLDDPKTLTLYQGNGSTAQVTLYATDTLDDVRSKLNNAIANGLGQSQYVTGDDRPDFVSFVTGGGVKGKDGLYVGSNVPNTSNSVDGTFVIRSLVPGANGKLNFSGDEDIIKALSLNVIQEAKESIFTVSVDDAHSGRGIAANVKIAGNVLYGVVNPNVDVEFDSMANMEAVWDKDNKKFNLLNKEGSYKTIIHLADNTTVFQIGANEGEDMGVHIGDMSAKALGINAILVTDRESAARSITVLDNAIQKVSTQRARLGAYQNRLEHTITNLTTASTNTTAAESRIRDTDMAKEMMNFTKLNILSQAGNSMLAQANSLPQSVLSLLR